MEPSRESGQIRTTASPSRSVSGIGPNFATVVADGPVVAHDEHVVRGYHDGSEVGHRPW